MTPDAEERAVTDQLIDTFIEKWLDFDLQIRERRGINEDLYDYLLELLEQLESEFEGRESIPKKLAEIFLDMWGAMISSADAQGAYDSDARSEIYQAADRLTFHARNICTN